MELENMHGPPGACGLALASNFWASDRDTKCQLF